MLDASPAPWQPVASELGAQFLNDYTRYILMSGPKKCGKTFYGCHKAAKHLYDEDGASVLLIAKRKHSAKEGVWKHLTRDVIEMELQRKARVLPWVAKPAKSSDTKGLGFSVRNALGTISYCRMFSVYRLKEIEDIMKNTAWSLIYVNEIDQFEDASIFQACVDQLRSTTVPVERRQFIADCNPPRDGINHWTYGLWVQPDESVDPEYLKKFKLYRFTHQDNLFITDEEIKEIYNKYKNDPDKLARYYRGDWVTSTEGSLFEDVWDSEIHVVGHADPSIPSSDWEILLPPQGTSEAFTAWDLGQTSHSISFGSKRWTDRGELAFDCLDEVVSIDLEISLPDIVDLVMEKMAFWDDVMMQRGAKVVRWNHWTDPSARRWSHLIASNEAAEVLRYSKGKLMLRPVIKPTIEHRIEVMRKLLANQHMALSVRCPHHIAAFKTIREESLRNLRYKKSHRRHTHPFDSWSYGISAETPTTIARRSTSASGIVRVAKL
jgi:hypothetical protein